MGSISATSHVEKVQQLQECERIHEQIEEIESHYQQRRKSLATIQDRRARHEEVQKEKKKRDDALRVLREHMHSMGGEANPEAQMAPEQPIQSTHETRKSSKRIPRVNFRSIMDQIHKLQKERKDQVDPFSVDLKLAKLWLKLKENERALEHYERATQPFRARGSLDLAQERIEEAEEKARHRRREAHRFFFVRALKNQSGFDAAAHMRSYLSLSSPHDRLETVTYLESLLRNQEYVEDAHATTVEDVNSMVLQHQSLGPLSDLRFELLQEMRQSNPADPYLLEAIGHFQVRLRDYAAARSTNDAFIQLPQTRQLTLFSALKEYTPSL